MAPEVIACDENLGATYDNRVSKVLSFHVRWYLCCSQRFRSLTYLLTHRFTSCFML